MLPLICCQLSSDLRPVVRVCEEGTATIVIVVRCLPPPPTAPAVAAPAPPAAASSAPPIAAPAPPAVAAPAPAAAASSASAIPAAAAAAPAPPVAPYKRSTSLHTSAWVQKAAAPGSVHGDRRCGQSLDLLRAGQCAALGAS